MLPNGVRKRLYAKIDTSAGPSECHPWTASFDRHGYGQLCVPKADGSGYTVARAHRLVYQDVHGAIPRRTPDGKWLELDHQCRQRACCNIRHLELVTRQANQLRGETFAARQAAQTECLRGHPFDEANTYERPDGRGRECLACHKYRRERAARAP